MERIRQSKHFVKYIDPVSGVVSFVFDNAFVPHTQSFYFTNPSITDDGRYIWMYCAFPPAGSMLNGRSLGVIDLENDTFIHFPDSMFIDATPLIDTKTGEAYWCNEIGLCKRTPDPKGKVELVAPVPDFMKNKGMLVKIATHPTFSYDRKKVCFDAFVGKTWMLGDINLENGEYTLWHEFDFCKNHAQFNPAKPDLILYAEDEHRDIADGTMRWIRRDENNKLMRLWTIEKGKEPVYIPPLFIEARHEWWSADGESIYYVDWYNGTIKYDTGNGEYAVVNPRGTWHAHCTADEMLFVADENEIDGKKWYRGCKSRVHFYNKHTDKYVNIVTENPALFTRENQCRYHIDPHPQFTMAEKAVMYTTTVTGKVSAAICDVEQLLKKTE